MNNTEYLDWATDFGVCYTPLEMLDKGVYLGVYTDTLSVPSEYKHHQKVTGVPKKNINCYADYSPTAINYHKTKEVKPNSVLSWWDWYIGYYGGRRSVEDSTYITNWKYYVSRLCKKLKEATLESDKDKVKQSLLEVGWDWELDFNDSVVSRNTRRIARVTGNVNLQTEFFKTNNSDLVPFEDDFGLTKLLKGFNPIKGGGVPKLELTASAKSLLPLITVEEENGYITVTGFNYRKFEALVKKVVNSSRFKYMFNLTGWRKFKFQSFFAVEVVRSIELVLETRKEPALLALKKKLITNTWLGEVVKSEPLNFNYSRLDRLNTTLLPKQREFLETYQELVPRLGLTGWLLAAAPGTGKSLSGISWHLVNEFDTTIVISPNNAVEDVWEDNITRFFKKTPKYWLSRPEYGDIKGDEEFIVCHYEHLGKLLPQLKRLKGKRVGMWLDESHNFNELTSARTNIMIEIALSYCEQSVLASGTPLKALGKELVPLFRIIDPRFNIHVEKRFIKVFGSTKGSVLKLLQFRMDRSAFKVAKEEVVQNEVNEYELEIEIPDYKPYLLSEVKEEIIKYVNERSKYYAERRDEYISEFFKYMGELPDSVTSTKDYSTYLNYTREMHRKFNPYEHNDLIKFCSKFEKNYIYPNLEPTERKLFKSVAGKYKYIILVIRGEALGRILTRRRIDCIKAMVPFSNLDTYVDEATKKTVIFTNYVEVVDDLNSYFVDRGYSPRLVYGKTNNELGDTLKAFKNDPKVNPIIATYNSLSTAVPLIEASTIVLFDSPFRNYIIEQTIARLDRYGQDSAISVIRAMLKTGEAPNLSTRSIQIAEWSKELVDSILNLSDVKESVLQTEDYNPSPLLTTEYFDVKKNELILDPLPEKLYHISFDPNLPKVLKPQLPAGSELTTRTSEDRYDYEPKIPRVCFSTSLIGAFRAVFPNIQEIVEKHGKDGIEFSVYERVGSSLDMGVSTNTLSQKAVWDAQITDEWWVLESTKIKKVGKVIFYCDSDDVWLEYDPECLSGNELIEHSPRDIEMELKLAI